jgi:hypothetical protein
MKLPSSGIIGLPGWLREDNKENHLTTLVLKGNVARPCTGRFLQKVLGIQECPAYRLDLAPRDYCF